MSVSKTDALPLGYTPQKAKVLGYEYGSSRHAKYMDVHEAPAYRQRTVLQQAISVGYRIGRKAHRATVLQQSEKRGDVGVVSDGSITQKDRSVWLRPSRRRRKKPLRTAASSQPVAKRDSA